MTPTPNSPQIAWSPAQRARLEAEWKRLRRDFALHPAVRVVPLHGDPPDEYRLEYRLRTLALEPSGRLVYVEDCIVHVWLPPQFPHAGPMLRSAIAAFHPNVSSDLIHLSPAWNPATGSLTDVVTRCGELLAFQVYDPSVVRNVTAMEWVSQYPQLIPTDPNAVFTPDADGGGLARIARSGAHALEQCRRQLNEMSQGVLDSSPNTSPSDLRRLGSEISLSLEAFSEADVPEALRSLAAELGAWARSMTTSGRSVWDELRDLYSHSRAAVAATHHLHQASEHVEAELCAAADLVQAQPSSNTAQTLARLPALVKLDPIVIRMRSALRQMEQHEAALRAALEGISVARPAAAGEPGGLLHERTTADVARGLSQASAAREQAVALLATIAPLATRARTEYAALDSLVAWAGFTDLVRRGNELTQRLVNLGAAGIEAYFLHLPAGAFGPYQFEERVDLDSAVIVARRISAGPIEIYESRSMTLLGKGTGNVRVTIPDEYGAQHEADVRATEHIDDLRIQLDYLLKTSRERASFLGKPAAADVSSQSSSWAVLFSAALQTPQSHETVTHVHRRAMDRWIALRADLDELAHFKQRVATYHLLERHAAFVPAVLTARGKAETSLAEANERLGFIAARSRRDEDTNQLVVAAQFAREHADRLKQHERATKDLAKVRKLLSLVAAELRACLADKRPLGKPGVPKLRLLAMPEEYAATGEQATNERLQSRVVELEQLVGTHLRAPKLSS